MRCSSYCTASEYQMSDLVKFFNDQGLEPRYFDDVIYIQTKNREEKGSVDMFFFPFGCVTIWGSDEIHEKSLLEDVAEFGIETGGFNETSSEFIYFEYQPTINDDSKTFIDELARTNISTPAMIASGA